MWSRLLTRGGCLQEVPNLVILLGNFRYSGKQARVVHKVDNAIHRINHYPVDNMVCLVKIYPVDSDLSGG